MYYVCVMVAMLDLRVLCILFTCMCTHTAVSHISVWVPVYMYCMCAYVNSVFQALKSVGMSRWGVGFQTPSPISSHGCQEASVRQSLRSDWTIPHPSGHPTLTLICIVAEHACTQHSQVLHIHNSPVIWFLGCGDGSLNVLQVTPRNCSSHGNLALFPHR